MEAMTAFYDALKLFTRVTLVPSMDTTLEQRDYTVEMVDTGASAKLLQPEASSPSRSQTQASPASSATTTSLSLRSPEVGLLALVVTPVFAAAIPGSTKFLQLSTPEPSPSRGSAKFGTVAPTTADRFPTPTSSFSGTPSPTTDATPSPSSDRFSATPLPSGDRSVDSGTIAPGVGLSPALFAAMAASPAGAGILDATHTPVNIQAPAGTAFSTLHRILTSDVTPVPAQSDSGSTSAITGVAFAVAGFALILLGVIIRKLQVIWKLYVATKARPNHQSRLPVVVADEGNVPPPLQHTIYAPPQSVSKPIVEAAGGTTDGVGGTGQSFPDAFTGAAQPAAEPAASKHKDGGGAGARRRVAVVKGYADPAQHVDHDGGGNYAELSFARKDAENGSLAPAFNVATSTTTMSIDEESGISSTLDVFQPMASAGRPAALQNLGLGRAVGDAAEDLARNCHIPGVSEAAAALSILVSLVANTRDNNNGMEANLRRCRAIVVMLQRAEKVLGKVSWYFSTWKA